MQQHPTRANKEQNASEAARAAVRAEATPLEKCVKCQGRGPSDGGESGFKTTCDKSLMLPRQAPLSALRARKGQRVVALGRRTVSTAGNTYSPCPVMPCSSRSITIAWRASGTRCGRFIFMVAVGMIHTPSRNRSPSSARMNFRLGLFVVTIAPAKTIECASKWMRF
jgi:hypothetical protein